MTLHENENILLKQLDNHIAQLEKPKEEDMIYFGEAPTQESIKKNQQNNQNEKQKNQKLSKSNKYSVDQNPDQMEEIFFDDDQNNNQAHNKFQKEIIMEETIEVIEYDASQQKQQKNEDANKISTINVQQQQKYLQNDELQQQQFKKQEEISLQHQNQNNVNMNQFYLNKKLQQQEKKKKSENKNNQIKKLKKDDFKYNQQSKIQNILEDEEDIGEIAEWIEVTANQQQNENQEEEDEFEKAIREGENNENILNNHNNDNQRPLHNQANIIKQQIDSVNQNQEEEKVSDKEKEKIMHQQKASQKLKKLEKGGYNNGNSGFMVNKLTNKAKFLHLENQEKQVPNNDQLQQEEANLEKEDKVIIQTEPQQNVKHEPISEKEIDIAEDEEEHKDAVMIEPEILNQSPNKNKKKNQAIEDDEWEMINQETLKNEQLHRRLSSSRGIKTIKYIEAWNEIKETDLTNELKKIQTIQKKETGFFAKLLNMCSKSNSLAKPNLMTERDLILAFTKVKFDDSNSLHFRMLFSIFSSLKDTDHCRRYGSHWEEIGFQGTDPATDIRDATGMLAILQMLSFVNTYQNFLKSCLLHSEHNVYSFPLACTLINITAYVIEFLKEGILSELINSERQVMSIMNIVYYATFCQFFKNYQESNSTIEQIGHVMSEAKETVKINVKKSVDDFKKYIEKYYKDNDTN